MLDKQQARKAAAAYVVRLRPSDGDGLTWIILDDMTRQTEHGWVFFWSTREWIENRNLTAMPLGNSPLYVDRTTGEVEPIGPTAYSVDENLATYEKRKYGGGTDERVGVMRRLGRWLRSFVAELVRP